MYMGLELKKRQGIRFALRLLYTVYCARNDTDGDRLILFAGIVISYRRQRKQKERGKQEK